MVIVLNGDIQCVDATPWQRRDAIGGDFVQRAQAHPDRLAGSGRVLIRKSGTEPLIRVMAEAEDEATLREVVDGIVAAVERAA